MNFNYFYLYSLIFLLSNCQIKDRFYEESSNNYLKIYDSIGTLRTNNKQYEFEIVNSDKKNYILIDHNNRSLMHLKYGKIFETYGLSKNVELTKLNMNNVLNQISTKKIYETDYLIRLSDPDSGYLLAHSKFLLVTNDLNNNKLNNVNNKYLIREEFNVPTIRWSGINYYWLDANKSLIKSTQVFHPHDNELVFELNTNLSNPDK